MTNELIATRLQTHATDLARCGENLYRIRAFRQAALTILALPQPVETILATRGRAGLQLLPGIGRSLADTIDHLTRTGELTA